MHENKKSKYDYCMAKTGKAITYTFVALLYNRNCLRYVLLTFAFGCNTLLTDWGQCIFAIVHSHQNIFGDKLRTFDPTRNFF